MQQPSVSIYQGKERLTCDRCGSSGAATCTKITSQDMVTVAFRALSWPLVRMMLSENHLVLTVRHTG